MLSRSLRRVPAIGIFKPNYIVAGQHKYADMDAALYFSEMQRKAALKGTVLRRGNVKSLIVKCEENFKPENVKLVFDGIELFQNKGWDFSSEISTYFIRFALKHGAAKEAAELLAKKEHRMGGWVSVTPYTNLANYLTSNGEVELLLNMTKTLVSKGAHVPAEWASEELLKAASTKGDAAVYDQAVAVVSKILPSPDVEKLKITYKAPEGATTDAEAK